MFSSATLEEALSTLGEVLTDRGHRVDIVVVGGGSLLLLRLIQRATKDLDVVAIVRDNRYEPGAPLPDYLAAAVRDVATALRLPEDWVNPGPSSLLDLGLPEGFRQRATILKFGGLTLHVASREDQIAFKLYAAVDQGPRSKHARDLKELGPSGSELDRAAAWCETHDPSAAFAQMLSEALTVFGGSRE